jgi:glycosyltransferase involved in cell wall biosynthesis
MRIAVLYTPLIAAGGAERQALEEVAHLKRRGHDVALLTFRVADEAMFVQGVTPSDLTVLSSRGGWLGQIVALRRALSNIRPEVLISHTSPELTWLATRGTDLPYLQYHNSPPFYIGADANPYMASRRYQRVFPRIRRDVAGYEELAAVTSVEPRRRVLAEARTFLKHHALGDARAVIVPSQRTLRELRMLHGVEATVVRGCLPSSLLARSLAVSPASVAPMVLSVCRLERVKRIDLLLHAFARARGEAPESRLVIAGKGPDLSRLRSITTTLSLDDCVEFAGYVPERQLWQLYATADVLAAPAMADFNIAPYEAMAMGCNVVWTNEMETDLDIESSGQVFVAAPDEASFARAISDALRAPRGRRADLRNMTWDARAERVDALVQQAANGQRIAA